MNNDQPRKPSIAWYWAFVVLVVGYSLYALPRAAIKRPVFEGFWCNLGYYVVSGAIMVGISWWIAVIVRRRFPNSPAIPGMVMIALVGAFVAIQQFWLNEIIQTALQSAS